MAKAVRQPTRDLADRAHSWVVSMLQVVMVAGMALAMVQRHWLDAMLILGIILVMYVPAILEQRLQVKASAEFELRFST